MAGGGLGSWHCWLKFAGAEVPAAWRRCVAGGIWCLAGPGFLARSGFVQHLSDPCLELGKCCSDTDGETGARSGDKPEVPQRVSGRAQRRTQASGCPAPPTKPCCLLGEILAKPLPTPDLPVSREWGCKGAGADRQRGPLLGGCLRRSPQPLSWGPGGC